MGDEYPNSLGIYRDEETFQVPRHEDGSVCQDCAAEMEPCSDHGKVPSARRARAPSTGDEGDEEE